MIYMTKLKEIFHLKWYKIVINMKIVKDSFLKGTEEEII